jgi:hypothetical protein
MTAKAKRKRNTAYWTHEHTVTKIAPTGEVIEAFVVLGSIDAYSKQKQVEDAGFFAIVRNNTTGTEEYRTPGCETTVEQK